MYVYNNDKLILLHSINGQIDMFGLNLYVNTCSPLSEAARLPKSWEYAGLLWNLYKSRLKIPGCQPKMLSLFSNLLCPINPFHTWCNMLLTGTHHFTVISNPLLLPSHSSIIPLQHPPLHYPLASTRVRDNHHHQTLTPFNIIGASTNSYTPYYNIAVSFDRFQEGRQLVILRRLTLASYL